MQNIHSIQSSTLKSVYKEWQKTATEEQLQHVDKVYHLCEDNYDGGGDVVCECMAPKEVLKELPTMDKVKEYCGWHVEGAMNARFGDDDDKELRYSKNHDNWKERCEDAPCCGCCS